MFTDNAFVTILMCSYLGVKEGNYKPYTALQWSEFGQKIGNSNIGEPASLLNMDKDSIVVVASDYNKGGTWTGAVKILKMNG